MAINTVSTVAVTMKLSKDLAARAKEAGLLDDQRFAEWVAAALERKEKIDQLFDMMEKLSALEPPLTQEEIDAEIQTYKEERAAERQQAG